MSKVQNYTLLSSHARIMEKTPPCVNMIIKSGIKRVFFSSKDPDDRSYNKSTELFKKNKIVAKNGILYLDIRNFYKSYIKYKENTLPFVTAKMAVSKDFYTIDRKKKMDYQHLLSWKGTSNEK